MHCRSPEVDITRVGDHGFDLPAYETSGAVGMDIRANLPDLGVIEVENCGPYFDIWRGGQGPYHKNKSPIIGVGFAVKIPPGFELQIRPRASSGVDLVAVVNSPGTIDQDYIGELGVILAPWPQRAYKYEHGDRIAQAVVAPVCDRVEWNEVDSLEETERGEGGFGSTGIK